MRDDRPRTLKARLAGALLALAAGVLGLASPAVAAPPATGTQTAAGEWRQVSAGGDHTCATTTGNALWCWGLNEYGQLGDGSAADSTVPVRVGAGAQWKTVTSGTDHTCALRTDNTLWCWGVNYGGQLGDGTTATRTTPVQVTTATDWRDVGTQGGVTCATRTDNSLWCWGSNANGQLGNGAYSNRTVPTKVGTADDWKNVSVSTGHVCGVRTDNSLWCWGMTNRGQVGNGDFNGNRPIWSPLRVGTDTNWATVVAGGEHTCAMRTDNTMWCWGDNVSGQVGSTQSANAQLTPLRVNTDTNWTSATLEAGERHTCDIRTDRTLWCWGWAPPIGVDNINNRQVPWRFGIESDWTSVSGGYLHSCGIRDGDGLWCWGMNRNGQLGDGTTEDVYYYPHRVPDPAA